MTQQKLNLNTLKTLLPKLPQDWLTLTTHRLDIYNESKAKSEFLDEFKKLIFSESIDESQLANLPTAYDYIRLGHQLSSVLEMALADINGVNDDQIITFASKTMPILAVLRHNIINNQTTHIFYEGKNPLIDEKRLKDIYGYQYNLTQVQQVSDIPSIDTGTVVFVTEQAFTENLNSNEHIDITINTQNDLGSYAIIQNAAANHFIAAIQHVRRRESIAMSPNNCLQVLNQIVGNETTSTTLNDPSQSTVEACIKENTGSQFRPLIASSGLSIQYAILMGLVEEAKTRHPNKPIKIILPPNCYGGTNDQSRRVADLIPEAGIVDLLVDGGADLVKSLEVALNSVADVNGVPIVLAEIPTNPRVEVPDMKSLGETLNKTRSTANGNTAIQPIFMVDQTFCPNVKLLHDESELVKVQTISFSSGSKFPSGGRCIAGYCAANAAAKDLMPLIAAHLDLSDNQADANQLNILAETMPSMPQRIVQAYEKTNDFVKRIQQLLPESKMFYVTDEIAQRGFMPSVFSLDLPVKAEDHQDKNELQKELNKKFIAYMIEKHPKDCKNCVSYGQLKGSYWTIPATSTQGTTKEDDKDYVVRASLAPNVNVDQLMESFEAFCKTNDLI